MKRMKITGTLAAACVIGLVAAASAMAHATNNPQWQILSKVLKAGETAGIGAEANGAQKFSFLGLTIECAKFGLLPGAGLIGSNAPAPGTSEGTIRYSECIVVSSPTCNINGAIPGEIETKLLRGLLVFLTKSGALNEDATASGTLFEPNTAPTFAEFVLSGTCPLSGTLKVGGTGILVNNLNATTLSTVKEIEAPAVTKKAYFVNEPGLVVKEKAGVKIEVSGAAATYSGRAKIVLASKDHWGIFN